MIYKTPEGVWSGMKETINTTSHRVFGSIAYIHVPDQQRNKMDDKDEKWHFHWLQCKFKSIQTI